MLFDLVWWLGLAWFAAWTLLPLGLIAAFGPVAGTLAGALLSPWSALVGMAALHRVLPESRPGVYRLPRDAGAVRWALKQWAPSLYLTVFQPVCGQSEWFLRLALRAFGARLGPEALLTSRTIVREPHHLQIGARTLVGEYAHLVCAYHARRGLLVVGLITLGDDVLIGAHALLGPGVRIDSGSILEHGVIVGARSSIGANTRIGAGTAIYNSVTIGNNVTIGKRCLVPAGRRIADGTCIPDGTVVNRAIPVRTGKTA